MMPSSVVDAMEDSLVAPGAREHCTDVLEPGAEDAEFAAGRGE